MSYFDLKNRNTGTYFQLKKQVQPVVDALSERRRFEDEKRKEQERIARQPKIDEARVKSQQHLAEAQRQSNKAQKADEWLQAFKPSNLWDATKKIGGKIGDWYSGQRDEMNAKRENFDENSKFSPLMSQDQRKFTTEEVINAQDKAGILGTGWSNIRNAPKAGAEIFTGLTDLASMGVEGSLRLFDKNDQADRYRQLYNQQGSLNKLRQFAEPKTPLEEGALRTADTADLFVGGGVRKSGSKFVGNLLKNTGEELAPDVTKKLAQKGGEITIGELTQNKSYIKKASEFVDDALKKGLADTEDWAKLNAIKGKKEITEKDMQKVDEVLDVIKARKAEKLRVSEFEKLKNKDEFLKNNFDQLKEQTDEIERRKLARDADGIGSPDFDNTSGTKIKSITTKINGKEEVLGAFAGIETDEDGNLTFDPKNAVIGIAGIHGFKKAKDAKLFKQGIERATSKQAYEQAKKNLIKDISKKPSLIDDFKSMLSPIKKLDEETKNIFNKWKSETTKAKLLANEEIAKLDIPGADIETIHKYQAGEETGFNKYIKQEFDKLFEEANDRGIDVEYRKNYLPQTYKNSKEEVKNAVAEYMFDNNISEDEIMRYLSGADISEDTAKRLKLNPTFQKDKVFPNYKTAMEYGLKPKYDNPAQLLAHYRQELETTLANKKLLEDLSWKGKILPSELAPNDWKPINLEFHPNGYYAPKDVAKSLNNIFKTEADGLGERLLEKSAWVSKKMQEIRLSAGIPKTAINFFSIGQMIKEVTAGNIKAVGAFIRANNLEASAKYFQDNVDVIKKMADEGIDIGQTVADFDKNIGMRKTMERFKQADVKEKLGILWNKAFEEKTFASFLPQLQIQTFKDAEARFLKKGLSANEAKQVAGDTVRAAMGVIDNFGRSKKTKDLFSTVFFAPHFRESVLNTLLNTAKSVTTQIKNPAFYKNRRLMAGMVVGYGIYDAINYELNGHHMWENPRGKVTELMIPTKDGATYIGFMPSFLAFARNMFEGGIATTKGDFDTATQKFGSVFSMPAKTLAEVISNKDYFGREIYLESDSNTERLKKIAGHIGTSVNHPFVAQSYELAKGEKPVYQALSEMAEMPLKFQSQKTIDNSGFYSGLDDAVNKIRKKKGDEQKQAIKDYLLTLDSDDSIKRASFLLREKGFDMTGVSQSKGLLEFEPTYNKIADASDNEAMNIINDLSNEEYELYKKKSSSEKSKMMRRTRDLLEQDPKKAIEYVRSLRDWEGDYVLDKLTGEEYDIYSSAK